MLKCYNCGVYGHKSPDCPNTKPPSQTSDTNKEAVIKHIHSDQEDNVERVKTNVLLVENRINGAPLNFNTLLPGQVNGVDVIIEFHPGASIS